MKGGEIACCIFGLLLIFIFLGALWTIVVVHSTETDRYLITGEKGGEKVERVVDLHRIYRRESATAPIIKETDGYGNVYHHVYYTKAEYDDTICGFDTINEIRRL